MRRRNRVATLTETFTPADTDLAVMTDAEKIDEILATNRKLLSVVGALMKAMGAHPMMRAFMVQNGLEV
jgi:hypothetical protein